MKLTKDNYKEYVPMEDQGLFEALLFDLEELNNLLADKDQKYRALYIDIQMEHDDYSCERTDPCPDYYGYYRLYCDKNPYNQIGIEMTIDELDSALCLLNEFTETELG